MALFTQDLERDVRAMLRRASDRRKLQQIPIAAQLCAAIGVADPCAMLRALVEQSFAATPRDRLLRDLVIACDLDRTETQDVCADRMGVSRRHFYRLRGDAIAAIASRVSALLSGDGFDRFAQSIATLPLAQRRTFIERMRTLIDSDRFEP